MKISLTKWLLGLLAVALATGGMYWQHQNATLSPEQRYRLQAIERGEITQTVSANGTLNPVVLVNVGTQVSGTVTPAVRRFQRQGREGAGLARTRRLLARRPG
jgi:HlyD family secretion protein